jgi:hypothetical protein
MYNVGNPARTPANCIETRLSDKTKKLRRNMKLLRMLGITLLVGATVTSAAAQSWQRTTNNPPANLGAMLLLTDGTVIAHNENDQNGNVATLHWYKLTPDINGSYVNGTWTQIADLPTGYGPLFFGSAVLPDGRVIVEGGEYNQYGNGFTKLGAIYDPVANTWTSVNPPSGWGNIGDASTAVLSNGTLMLANTTTKQAALLNPSTLTWTATGTGKFDNNDEEGWQLLPGGNVLTVDAYVAQNDPTGKNYEIYNSSAGSWSVAGTTPVQLWDSAANCGGHGSNEVGPAVLMPNGTVYATGANTCGAGHTAIYDVSTGTWTAGPDFPGTYDEADAPAALETNGNAIIFSSPGIFNAGSVVFEWNGSSLTQIPAPPNAINVSSFQGHFLMLPSGQIMYTDYTQDVELFTSAGSPYTGYTPTVLLPNLTMTHGTTVVLNGRNFIGASQNNFYGDDYQDATNYPIVRFTNVATGHVFYGRTHGHNTMAVGYHGPTYTHVDIPNDIELGTTHLQVITNGIASQNYMVIIN